VLRIMRLEDSIIHGAEAMAMYADHDTYPDCGSLEIEFAINRMALSRSGFATEDASVKIYRQTMHRYYASPTEYDAEVMSAVTYLRENKILYYTAPKLRLGQDVTPLLAKCDMLRPDGSAAGSLLESCKTPRVLVGGFSTT